MIFKNRWAIDHRMPAGESMIRRSKKTRIICEYSSSMKVDYFLIITVVLLNLLSILIVHSDDGSRDNNYIFDRKMGSDIGSILSKIGLFKHKPHQK